MALDKNSQVMPITGAYRSRYKELRDEFIENGWRSHMKEIADFMLPRRGRYLDGDNEKINDGRRKDQKIINAKATECLEIGAAGLQTGLIPQGDLWFSLGVSNAEIQKNKAVKQWLTNTRDGILDTLNKSNFYESALLYFKEIMAFGIGCFVIDEDFETTARFRTLTVGEYYFGLDERFRPDTLCYRYPLTIRQAIRTFGETNLSEKVIARSKTAEGLEDIIYIVQIIQRNDDFDPTVTTSAKKRYVSKHFEECGNEDKFLKESGYDTKPFAVARWEAVGSDVYSDSRGMVALGDTKMLQKMEETKLKALDKKINPPMNAPMNMKGKGGTLVAGGINYVDTMVGGQGFSPTYQVDINLQDAAFELDRVEQRLERLFYTKMFQIVINEDKRMTATEVAQRKADQLVLIGPNINKIISECLDVTIDRVYAIKAKNGELSPMPVELLNVAVNIDYHSIFVIAQKLAKIKPLEQFMTYVGTLSQLQPTVWDKIDTDQVIDDVAEALSISPDLVRDANEVKVIRDSRAAAIQQQRQREQDMQDAETVKTLSDSKMKDGQNVIEKMAAR